MTGELSLTGKVLPVGGIKEKTLAARRSGADTVILPAANRRDYEELPQYVKDLVKVHFVKEYEEVFNIAFPSDTISSPITNQTAPEISA
jgi:ATP-dependent Lon protease